MNIYHNIASLKIYNKLKGTAAKESKETDKLSSGLRINRASDDSAGLSISEKMRSQIRGLEQAVKNSQDAISMLQTAEGTLGNIHDLLQRTRELAVQAATDTNNITDRSVIQQEIEQQMKEIDNISSNTEFNQIHLLDGSKSITTETIPAQYQTYSAASICVWKIPFNPVDGAGRFGISNLDTMTFAQFEFKDTPDSGDPWIDVQIGSDLAATLNNLRDTFYQVKAGTYRFPQERSSIVNADMDILGNFVIITSNDDFDMTVNPADGIEGSAYLTGTPATFSIEKFPSKTVIHDNRISVQVGANDGQVMKVEFPKTTVSELGISGINVMDSQGASEAITQLDTAISLVSAGRSQLGAYQNRLEHTINNLNTSSENLTAAESRIRDVDMAKEMMARSKSGILAEAAQTMLAQANQQPQQVLQLLR